MDLWLHKPPISVLLGMNFSPTICYLVKSGRWWHSEIYTGHCHRVRAHSWKYRSFIVNYCHQRCNGSLKRFDFDDDQPWWMLYAIKLQWRETLPIRLLRLTDWKLCQAGFQMSWFWRTGTGDDYNEPSSRLVKPVSSIWKRAIRRCLDLEDKSIVALSHSILEPTCLCTNRGSPGFSRSGRVLWMCPFNPVSSISN